MAAGVVIDRTSADEEARAEVDVLNSRLQKTSQLTKKIQASIARLETTGKGVRDVIGPLNGETKRLQTMNNNIDAVLVAMEKLRQQADSKNDEEQTIRQGPERIGLNNYLASLRRLKRSLADIQTSNLRANQQTMTELERLIKFGNNLLEGYFQKLLTAETPRQIEPLQYITKDRAFPVLSQDKYARLGLINAYIAESYGPRSGTLPPQESPTAKLYVDIRGPYLSSSLANLSMASVNTAKKKNPDAIYRSGANAIGSYAEAMEGLFLAEYENICNIFTRDDWGSVFQAICQGSVAELARTIRELNNHIKSHITTDCFLAYEITSVITTLSNKLDSRTGELKSSLAAALKPVRETAKSSLAELLDDVKRRIMGLQTLPPDGAPIPLVSETLQRLQNMTEFITPLSTIMLSLGDGGWKSNSGGGRLNDTVPSLASFDVRADGRDIFANYCVDTVDNLLTSLYQKTQSVLRGKSVQGVFIGNSVVIADRMIRESELFALLESRMGFMEQWRKRAISLYTDSCKDLSTYLFDVIRTGGQRPTSGQADSASILKSLSTKDKDSIKAKFQAFNSGFDDMVIKHRTYSMEREVRQMFAKAVQQMLEPLYNRFWDRYHEIDKGKGKHVKYDKSSISSVFMSLY